MKIVLEKYNPLSDDLVNNFDLFKKKFPSEVLNKFYQNHGPNSNKPWSDDTVEEWSNYPHIDELLSRDFTEEDLKKSWIVRCPGSYIFSSERKGDEDTGDKSGFDRPVDSLVKNKEKNIENLNKHGGFVGEHAGVLACRLRYDKNTGRWQLTKNKGNNRMAKKFLCNFGEDSEFLIEFRFHNMDHSTEEQMRIEAITHSADAEDRNSQNEEQRFFSSLRAGNEFTIDCYEFLRDNGLDYRNVIAKEGNETFDGDKRLSLASLKGLMSGKNGGHFKKYGKENVEQAIKTARTIALNITKEETIGATAIECLAMMFEAFTQPQKLKTDDGREKVQPARFSKDELHSFFEEFYEVKGKPTANKFFSNNKTLGLKDIQQSRGIKDLVYICSNVFFADPIYNLHAYYLALPKSDGSNNRKNTMSIHCAAMQKLRNRITAIEATKTINTMLSAS